MNEYFKDLLVGFTILAVALFIVWSIQNSNSYHPEIPECSSYPY